MVTFSFQLDVKPFVERLGVMQAGLADRTRLHERIVITLQRRTYKRWNSLEPELGAFTMLTRTGSSPLSDKGTLKQSTTGTNPATISTAMGTLNKAEKTASTFGTNIRGARLHNDGGDVTPRSARNLALPATKEAKQHKSPRDFPRDLFFVPPRSDNSTATGWLAETRGRGKRARLVRHYLLKPRVTIPKRRFMPTEAEVLEDTQKVGSHYLRELAAGKSNPSPEPA